MTVLVDESATGGRKHRFVAQVVEIERHSASSAARRLTTVFGPGPDGRARPAAPPACLPDLVPRRLRPRLPRPAHGTWATPLDDHQGTAMTASGTASGCCRWPRWPVPDVAGPGPLGRLVRRHVPRRTLTLAAAATTDPAALRGWAATARGAASPDGRDPRGRVRWRRRRAGGVGGDGLAGRRPDRRRRGRSGCRRCWPPATASAAQHRPGRGASRSGPAGWPTSWPSGSVSSRPSPPPLRDRPAAIRPQVAALLRRLSAPVAHRGGAARLRRRPRRRDRRPGRRRPDARVPAPRPRPRRGC